MKRISLKKIITFKKKNNDIKEKTEYLENLKEDLEEAFLYI